MEWNRWQVVTLVAASGTQVELATRELHSDARLWVRGALPESPLGSLIALLEVEREIVVVSTSGRTVAKRSGAGGGGDGVAAMGSGEAASGGDDAVSGGGLTSRWLVVARRCGWQLLCA